jgi:serine/threonine protein phosphatase PrpC
VTDTTASAAAPQENDAPARTKGEVTIKLFARTDVGQVREHNEDNFLVADLTKRVRGLQEENRIVTVGKNGNVVAVCDGMGGAAAGEVASQLAVDIIYEKMTEDVSPDVQLGRNDIARRLVRAVEAAGLRIFEAAKSDRTRRGMGTTVTAAALVDDHLFLAQVGDSRAYILRDGTLVQVTRDQSLVNQLIEAGQLTEEEAETFEHNNIILQALGTAETVQVDLTFAELRQGDRLMLCSDGLSGMVRNDEIREVLKTTADPLEACKSLTERANAAGGHDNITVIVAQFDGEGLKALAPDEEPLKYRKYALPEEPTDPARKAVPMPAALQPDGASAPAAADAAVAAPSAAWSSLEEERIEIPGTHVPAGVVVALILGVIALLAGTAFLLLR